MIRNYLRFMRSPAPPLMPVFRSAAQAKVLTALLLRPEVERSLTDLARETGVALSTVHDEAVRLIQAGILSERVAGRSHLLRANTDNPVIRPLTELVALTFGPSAVVAEEFVDMAGVEQVILFGSWAARYLGEPGPPPHDVDVLVVGTADRAEMYDAADRAEQRLGTPVHPVLASPERFAEAADPLVRQIKASPTVTVIDRTADGED
jgi:predicted nucleotidyltransferase